MAFMKFQFSLSTLLICITMLALVCALCVKIRVEKEFDLELKSEHVVITHHLMKYRAPPDGSDIARRLALWGPLAVAGTLACLWGIRKSRSHLNQNPPQSNPEGIAAISRRLSASDTAGRD
jgi:hypothetical protein